MVWIWLLSILRFRIRMKPRYSDVRYIYPYPWRESDRDGVSGLSQQAEGESIRTDTGLLVVRKIHVSVSADGFKEIAGRLRPGRYNERMCLRDNMLPIPKWRRKEKEATAGENIIRTKIVENSAGWSQFRTEMLGCPHAYTDGDDFRRLPTRNSL